MPDTARVVGTTRAFSTAMQDHLERRMRELCKGVGGAYGVEVDLTYQRRYPPTINHPKETEFAAQAAMRVVGVENVIRNEPPIMAAEDFAWMLLEQPGSYVWIGNDPQHQNGCMLHNPGYDFNDRILPIGASYWVELAESWLTTHPTTF